MPPRAVFTEACSDAKKAARRITGSISNLYGHQFVVHLDADYHPRVHRNDVDGDAVPVPHFGVILEMDDWRILSGRLKVAGQTFVIEPHIRFQGQAGEQATMFLYDPSGNALEFKAFADDAMIFAVD